MTLAQPLPQIRSRWRVASDLLDETSEAAQHEAEKQAIAKDVRKLLPYVWILHPTDGPMKFQPWSWQPALLYLWMIERLVVILKARQLGVSWLAAIYALWVAMFRHGQNVLVVSKGQDDSNKFLDKVKFIYRRLPEWMKPYHTENASEITFPDLDSSIVALPATENVGRSLTASLVILDEHGHQHWAKAIMLALKPAVEKGQLISLSTANGGGSLHAEIYKEARGDRRPLPVRLDGGPELPLLTTDSIGENRYRPVFIPASARPDRQDPQWRIQARAEMGKLSDAEFTQEYPENDLEAFVITGRPVFRPEDIARQTVEMPLRDEKDNAYEPGFFIYRRPEKGKVYLIGADVGEGLEKSDFSSAGVFERDTMEQVAQLRGRWSPDIYATRLDRLARMYGVHSEGSYATTVIVAVERNNHGHAVLLSLGKLHDVGAPYSIYRSRDKRRGWLTSNATRPVMVDQLEAALRLGEMTIHDAGTVDQLTSFHWSDEGRAEAEQGSHDDDVFAAGIALQVRRVAFGRVLDVPATEKAAA